MYFLQCDKGLSKMNRKLNNEPIYMSNVVTHHIRPEPGTMPPVFFPLYDVVSTFYQHSNTCAHC